MQPIQANVYAGIDTHADSHHVAVIDEHGRALGDQGFPTTTSGYRRIVEFLHGSGHVLAVGVEGTGSYGAERTRVLAAGRFAVMEVNRPNRQQIGRSSGPVGCRNEASDEKHRQPSHLDAEPG